MMQYAEYRMVFPAECAHCGELAVGYARLPGEERVCHPDDWRRPDCYRRVTVYGEKLGALKNVTPKPGGVTSIVPEKPPVCCAKCGEDVQVENWGGGVPLPVNGTMFTSRGNYGSTVWDPGGTTDRRYLLAVICDKCMRELAMAGSILVVTPPPPDIRPPEVGLWLDLQDEQEPDAAAASDTEG
jgi:hypothetical protein